MKVLINSFCCTGWNWSCWFIGWRPSCSWSHSTTATMAQVWKYACHYLGWKFILLVRVLILIMSLSRVVVQGPGPGPRYGHVMALVGQRYLMAIGGNDG